MPTMNPFEALLSPMMEPKNPEKQRLLAAGLRRDYDYGTVMQMMGLEPLQQAGQGLQKQALGGLELAVNKQQEASRERQRMAEREEEREWRKLQQQATENYHNAMIGLDRDKLNQGSFEIYTDKETGEQWKLDKRTGQVMPVGGPSQGAPTPRPDMGDQSTLPMVGFNMAPAGLKLTDVQDKSRFYAQSMAESVPEMHAILAQGYVPTRLDIMAAGPPMSGVGGILQKNTPSSWSSPQARAFYTAGRTALAAVLRKESGAAITDDEWAQYGPIYLPWPGNSPEEIKQKLARLDSAMHQMAMGAGPASKYWIAPRYDQPKPEGSWGGGTPTTPGAAPPKTYKYDANGNPVN